MVVAHTVRSVRARHTWPTPVAATDHQRERGKRMPMLKEMKAYAHLKPGQDGTKRLVEQYGDALLCVRYRFDEVRGVKLKTVEIIVDEKPLRTPRFKDNDLVPVRVAYDEQEMRQQLRAMRARWDSQRKLWYVRYGLIRGTPLAELYA